LTSLKKSVYKMEYEFTIIEKVDGEIQFNGTNQPIEKIETEGLVVKTEDIFEMALTLRNLNS